MKDQITLAVMVRDDAERLDRCIASIKDFVGAIAVLDTGSKDGSREVARKYGARVKEIVWPDHFGNALNALLEMVETPWTLRLDSDEWFDADQAERLDALIQDDATSAYSLVRRDLRPGGEYDQRQTLRLWRTHEKVRYRGAVHEVIPPEWILDAFPNRVQAASDVFFWHDGYLTGANEKFKRNLDLLMDEVAQEPGNLNTRAMLASTLVASGDPRGRDQLRQLAKSLLELPGPELSPQIALALGMYFEGLSPAELADPQVWKLVKKATAWYPNVPVVLYFAAIAERRRNNLQPALTYLLQLESLVETDSYDRSTSVPPEVIGAWLWNALGFVASQLGRQDIVRRAQGRLASLGR